MRDRLLLSAGHALLAMCGFVWLYSMAIAFTADAGRSAPNSLLCGIGVFAVVFAASQARLRLARGHVVDVIQPMPRPIVERIVLDGSLATVRFTDTPAERPARLPRGNAITRDQDLPSHPDVT